ncbi:MAG: SH3 domain-containing protein [Anaerolineae bacterium]
MSKNALPKWMPVFALVVLLCACQPTESTHIETGVPLTVNLPPGSTRRVYSFNANPASPTTLRFDSSIPGAPFTAEILDNSGQVVAVLGGGSVQTASLTLAPASGMYQVALSSANPDAQGSVRLSIVDNPQAADSSETQASSNPPAADCIITATHPGGVNVRVQPGLSYDILGVMPPDTSLPADARTSNGWYRVYNAGQGGWVSGDVVSASGMCADLPLQIIPASERAAATSGQFVSALSVNTNYAPYDAAAYYFEVPDDRGGDFSESLSYPDGDGSDRVLLAVSGLTSASTGGHPYTVTMVCSGTGAENLRWGAPENPSLGCGDSAGITFSAAYDRQSLVVSLPVGTGQSNVDYTLHAAPIAPDDAPTLGMGVDLNAGGALSERLSYPGGDHSDTIQMAMANLTDQVPDNYRDVLVSLECSGNGIEYVRWGTPGGPTYPCGASMTLPLSYAEYIKTLLVMLPDNSGESYVSYTLHARPVALPDTQQFSFGFDRDSGGLFNETLSFPYGDSSDALLVNVNNLTETPPNNYRSVQLTLLCGGLGTENVRWGLPDNPAMLCNTTMTVPFLYGAVGQDVIISVPAGSSASYVRYTLYAVPVP